MKLDGTYLSSISSTSFELPLGSSTENIVKIRFFSFNYNPEGCSARLYSDLIETTTSNSGGLSGLTCTSDSISNACRSINVDNSV